MIVEAQQKARELAAVTGGTGVGALEYVSDPAPILVGGFLGRLQSFDPLDGAAFQGEGTHVSFSIGFKFANE